jgi:hypothetical protein
LVFKEGRLEEAEAAFRKGLSSNIPERRTRSALHEHLGDVLFLQSRLDEAKIQWHLAFGEAESEKRIIQKLRALNHEAELRNYPTNKQPLKIGTSGDE